MHLLVMKRTVGETMLIEFESRKYWRSASAQLAKLTSTMVLCKVFRLCRRLSNVTNWHYASAVRPLPRTHLVP